MSTNNQEYLQELMDKYQYGINSLPFVLEYMKENFSEKQIQSVSPYGFSIGSSNHGEPISYKHESGNCFFFGTLEICINPTDGELQDEKIELVIRSYYNSTPFNKHFTRIIEIENLINEITVSNELFDKIELTQLSNKYDVYVTFLGFKIDVR